ncbi:MAG TPA: sulfatase-like hydrolase/transferase [Acidobacteriaceae bacterium]
MDRRKFIALVSSGVAATGQASAFSLPTAGEAKADAFKPRKRQRAPNVILMICDDLGFGDLGCYGSKLPTPNLDRMASEGTRFTRFNAGHPICSASRAALLTGRYGLRSGTTGAFGPNDKSGTSLDETLLSNLFHAGGYKTKAIGKWHLGSTPQYLPTSRGFDSFYGVPYSVDMYPMPLMRDTTVLEAEADRKLLTPRYTDEAVKFIDESDATPFFMYLGFSYPHERAVASERFAGKTAFGDVGDAVAEIDWSAGEILRAVERKGIASDTLVLFTSDHGPWYQGCPGMLRGRKASTFEGGFRVPLLARWHGTIEPGKVVEEPCSNLDILPSLAAMCGLKLPEKPLDGVDISTLFSGGGKTIEAKPRIYFAAMGNRGLDVHCIRKGDWKLRVAQGIGGEIYLNDRMTAARESAWLQNPELYNVSLDPAESYDVAKFHPDVVAALKRDLEELMPSFPPNVVDAYAKLKLKLGNASTPAGASPRPYTAPKEA